MMLILMFLALLYFSNGNNQVLTLQSDIYSEFYKPSLDDYKEEESAWMLLAGEIGEFIQADSLGSKYGPSGLSDYNLNTTWAINGRLSPMISFRLIFPFNTSYEDGSPWVFSGKILLFNGYCKSVKLWNENSRIKKLNVYYNSGLLCHVTLQDTWHLQYFSLKDFFYDKRENNTGKIKLKSGDIISLEIVDTYKGSKFEDVCLSGLYGEINDGN